MASRPILTTFLASVKLAPEKQEDVRTTLLEFENLNDDDKHRSRPSLLENVFSLILGDNASIQNSPSYQELKSKPWSTNCHLSPRVIITPENALEVSSALMLCQILGASFSIRGGGHLHIPGFNSNDGGVVISMCKLKTLTVSGDKKIASIGAGLTWVEVYNGLAEYGVTVTGGRVPSVGVSGLLLGGGLSFQNSEHGFSCNGVENYEVVLANGSIVNANANEHKDLSGH